MEKKKKYSGNYVYGNVAYDIQPEIEVRKKHRTIKKSKNKSNKKLKMIGRILVITIVSFLTLTRFASMVKMTFDIRTVKSDIKKIQEQNENTRVEIAKMNNIKNIESTAINKLGMIIPSKTQVVYIDLKPLTIQNDKVKKEPKTAVNKIVQKIFALIH